MFVSLGGEGGGGDLSGGLSGRVDFLILYSPGFQHPKVDRYKLLKLC